MLEFAPCHADRDTYSGHLWRDVIVTFTAMTNNVSIDLPSEPHYLGGEWPIESGWSRRVINVPDPSASTKPAGSVAPPSEVLQVMGVDSGV